MPRLGFGVTNTLECGVICHMQNSDQWRRLGNNHRDLHNATVGRRDRDAGIHAGGWQDEEKEGGHVT